MTGEGQRRRVAVAGASGRMGRALIDAITASPDLVLAAAFDVAGSSAIGSDAAAFLGRPSGIVVSGDARAALAASEVLIDFTRPEGTLAHLALCRELGVAAVVGTTGFDAAQKQAIAAHAEHIAIVLAPNMSVGVNVVLKLLDVAGRALAEGFDVEIVETHHRMKVDAPSGTALLLGEAVAGARGVDLRQVAVRGRDGITGAREAGAIGFASLRGGSVAGDHSVLFFADDERIELAHRAENRTIFARGAVRGAAWLIGRAAGRYAMPQVLGL